MSKPKDPADIQCPACGYYCLGKGGFGCIDKPSLQNTAPPPSAGLDEILEQHYWDISSEGWKQADKIAKAKLESLLEVERLRAVSDILAGIRSGIMSVEGAEALPGTQATLRTIDRLEAVVEAQAPTGGTYD